MNTVTRPASGKYRNSHSQPFASATVSLQRMPFHTSPQTNSYPLQHLSPSSPLPSQWSSPGTTLFPSVCHFLVSNTNRGGCLPFPDQMARPTGQALAVDHTARTQAWHLEVSDIYFTGTDEYSKAPWWWLVKLCHCFNLCINMRFNLQESENTVAIPVNSTPTVTIVILDSLQMSDTINI